MAAHTKNYHAFQIIFTLKWLFNNQDFAA